MRNINTYIYEAIISKDSIDEAIVKGHIQKKETPNIVIDNKLIKTIQDLVKKNILNCGKRTEGIKRPAMHLYFVATSGWFVKRFRFWKNCIEIEPEGQTKVIKDNFEQVQPQIEETFEKYKKANLSLFLDAQNFEKNKDIVKQLFEKCNGVVSKSLEKYHIKASFTDLKDLYKFISLLHTL